MLIYAEIFEVEALYKWLSRFKERVAAGLAELSLAPKNNANKISEAVKKRLLKLKEKHTYRGAYKIRTLYAAKYPGEHTPARSAVEELLKRRDTPAGKSGQGKRRKTGCRRGWRRKSRRMCGRLITKGGGGRGRASSVCR
jgi:hypothetical protein